MRTALGTMDRRIVIGLGLQYALMEWFAAGKSVVVVTTLEAIAFAVYTAAGLMGFVIGGVKRRGQPVSGVFPLFMLVLWTVALFSHLKSGIHPPAAHAFNAAGIATSAIVLCTVLFALNPDSAAGTGDGSPDPKLRFEAAPQPETKPGIKVRT